jgi:TolB protein
MDWKFMKLCALLLFLSLGTLFSAHAEKFNLEVYASNLDSISLAILPLKNTGDVAIAKNEPWKVLASDLEFSGRVSVFRVLKADPAEFAKNNVPLYVDGDYEVFGKFARVGFTLRDAKSSEVLLEKKYEGELGQTRAMAHRFADMLVEMLFGDKGIFESRMLFVKDEGAKKNIMIMDWDGDNMRQLTITSTLNIFPAFVDSTAFLWTSFIRGHPDIYKASFGGRGGALISSRYIEASPSYSPVTGKVVFTSSRDGNMEIYTCDIDGKNIRRLTTARSIETSPCWSPNGFQIAFTSDRIGAPRIFVMDADGSNVHQLAFEGGYQDSPAWSPKGDKIAYQCITNGKFEIWTANTDGSNIFQVTTCPGDNEYPTWASDGMHIAFSSKRGAGSDLYAVKADGTRMIRLTTTGNAKMPDWSNF